MFVFQETKKVIKMLLIWIGINEITNYLCGILFGRDLPSSLVS